MRRKVIVDMLLKGLYKGGDIVRISFDQGGPDPHEPLLELERHVG